MKRLSRLPSLQSLTLRVEDLDHDDLTRLFKFCTRFERVIIERCKVYIDKYTRLSEQEVERYLDKQEKAHDSISKYNFKELTVLADCGIGLWGFISKCDDLQVLRFRHAGHKSDGFYERRRLQDLTKCLSSEGLLPKLQYLELGLLKIEDPTNILKNARFMRKLWTVDVNLEVHQFNASFIALREINVLNGSLDFWKKVLSSCSGLESAETVQLSPSEVIDGGRWVCSRLVAVRFRLKGGEREAWDRKRLVQKFSEKIAELRNLETLHLSLNQMGKLFDHEKWSEIEASRKWVSFEFSYR